jgi:hypothetical protein
MHGSAGPIPRHIKEQLGYLLAVQIVQQSSPESILRPIDHAPILVI